MSPRSPRSQPRLVAVTGGIACGKSEVGNILSRHGIAVWDADQAVHDLTAPGSPWVESIATEFGPEMRRPNGGLDRPKLAEKIFSDPKERIRLNALIHPPVFERCAAWCREQRRRRRDAAVLAPLFYETGRETREHWDAVICVSDREERVLRRLYARGLSLEEARKRIAAQWPLKEKEARADFLIHNHAGLAELEEETLAVWRRMVL